MNNRETQLWNYIDGIGTAEERKKTADLLAADASFYALYQELLALNNILAKIEIDEPSMSFTRNVMEAVKKEARPIPLKTKVSQTFIYAIAALFALTLGSLVVYAFSSADYGNSIKINYDDFEKALLNPTTLYVFILADAILLLVFLDRYLRKGMRIK